MRLRKLAELRHGLVAVYRPAAATRPACLTHCGDAAADALSSAEPQQTNEEAREAELTQWDFATVRGVERRGAGV